MKNKLSALIHNHSTWFANFMCNLSATVLGIALTFGTTWWIERIQRIDAAEDSAERCMTNMEQRCKSLDKLFHEMMRQDTILQAVTTQWPNVTDDTLILFKNVFGTTNFESINHSAETVFKNSYENAHLLGDFAEAIGTGFEFLDWMEQKYNDVDELRLSTFHEVLTDDAFSTTLTDKQKVDLMLRQPEVHYFILQYHGWTTVLSQSLAFVQKKMLPDFRKLWRGEITEIKLDSIKSKF